ETQQELRELQAAMPARKKVYQSLGIMGGLFLAVLIL
ncbi:MAG TPA: stage III sporulation protein AB, partial [Candidatus Blautia avistercoris]|nr:stage III sporulation protein AB [Candidatus Blautia avistercoris]